MMLNVPLVMQGNGTHDCGPACIAMLMRYYGLDSSVETVNSELDRDVGEGMYPFDVGSYLVSNFFDVSIVSFDANAVMKNDADMSPKLVIERLGETYCYGRVSDAMRTFLEVGGNIEFRIPTLDELAGEIADMRPVIVNMTNDFMFGEYPGFNLHYNLVTGLGNGFVYAKDPLYGEVRYSNDEFLFGVYASSRGFCNFIKVEEII